MTAGADVLLHGRVIGSLVEDERSQWVFRFAETYRRMAHRPTLGQKFEDDLTIAYRGKKGGLPLLFATLASAIVCMSGSSAREYWSRAPGGASGGKTPILAAHLGIADGDDITLLERLGRDLPGAVEVRQITETPGEQVSELARAIEPTEPIDQDGEWLRFSLAGIQLKFSVIIAEQRITLPAHGRLGDWLVKLPSRRFPGLCENEYAIMKWAQAAGFEVPELVLRESSALVGTLGEHAEAGTRVLAIRRFDRGDGGQKTHQEDFAQIVNLYPKYKYDHFSYEDVARLAAGIVGDEAIDEMIRRLVLMIASGNGDAHLKNWSLLYPDRIRARLAPLYDQVATVAWPEDLARSLALNFGGTKTMSQLGRDTLATFATRAGFDRERVTALVDSTLARLTTAWSECTRASDWPLPCPTCGHAPRALGEDPAAARQPAITTLSHRAQLTPP